MPFLGAGRVIPSRELTQGATMIGGSIDRNIYCVNAFELQMTVFYFYSER